MELLLKVLGRGDTESPFDGALRRVAASGALDLACPYLSVGLLEDLVAGVPQFRLVTDAEEWLRAYARPARQEILAFIAARPDCVRHYRDLHAKVALSPTCAMFGSANFTQRGLFERQEVGALVHDPAQVAALQDWFDGVWRSAVSIDLVTLASYVASLPREGSEGDSGERKLPPPNHRQGNDGRPAGDQTPESSGESSFTDEEDRLVDRLASCISAAWANQYLDSLQRLMGAIGLRPDDPRVLTPIPKSSGALTVTFNTRGVLYRAGVTTGDIESPGAAIIQTDVSVVERSPSRAMVVGTYQYKRQSGEKGTPPIVVEFADFSFLDDPSIFDNWVLASRQELARRDIAPKHKLHCPSVVRAALDPAYRRRLLAELAWPDA